MRYIERVMGVDLEAAREEVARKVDLIEGFPGAEAVVSDGFRYVLDGRKVVTITPIKSRNIRTGKAKSA